jgi:hypothetical protein
MRISGNACSTLHAVSPPDVAPSFFHGAASALKELQGFLARIQPATARGLDHVAGLKPRAL